MPTGPGGICARGSLILCSASALASGMNNRNGTFVSSCKICNNRIFGGGLKLVVGARSPTPTPHWLRAWSFNLLKQQLITIHRKKMWGGQQGS